MNRFAFESYLLLLRIDLMMRLGDLRSVHALLRGTKVAIVNGGARPTAEDLCHAIDLACVLYLKRVLCLQRSTATTLLLRHYGHKAEMVIGAQMLPFKSHAWVELDGVIVNDKPYMLDIYQVLERC
jgi:Transglutaminase-like superfamily